MYEVKKVDHVARPEFLATDHKTSQTGTGTQAMGVTVGDRKIIKAGTIFPANDETAIGIVISDVDVTNGDMPVAYIDHGSVYTNRLPVPIADTAKAALKNIFFREYK